MKQMIKRGGNVYIKKKKYNEGMKKVQIGRIIFMYKVKKNNDERREWVSKSVQEGTRASKAQ